MANIIQVKRGLEANRSSVTPAAGEFLYTTDEKRVYIGDGSTAGGNAISSSSVTLPLEERTSNTMLGAADQGKYIKLNGNFTQTFDAAATLGAGWWCYLENTANPDVSAGVNASSIQYIASANMPNISGAYQFCTNATGTRVYYIQTSLAD